MKKMSITQIRSTIKTTKNQKLNIQALGLGKIGSNVILPATPAIQGMVVKVKHLVNVKVL